MYKLMEAGRKQWRWLIGGAVVGLGFGLVGCGGGGQSVAPDISGSQTTNTGNGAQAGAPGMMLTASATATVLNGKGGVEGWVFADAHNVISLGYGPTPAKGLAPVANVLAAVKPVAVPVSGLTTTARTDAKGHFLLSNIPAGLYLLDLTPPKGTIAPIHLTVVADATIEIGPPPITRDAAFQRVKKNLGATQPDYLSIVATQQPVPAGVTIAPGLGNKFGQPDATLAFHTLHPSWFFYVDALSQGLYQHPVTYIFIDTVTGAYTTKAALSYPVINGVAYYRRRDVKYPDLMQVPTSPDVAPSATPNPTANLVAERSVNSGIQQVSLPGGQGRPHLVARDNSTCGGAGKSYAICVQGGDELSISISEIHIKNMVAQMAGGAVDLYEIKPLTPDATSPTSAIKNEINIMNNTMQPCDTFYFTFVGHGAGGGGANVLYKANTKWNPFDDNSENQFIDATTIGGLLAQVKACHMVIYLDCCYSGSWIPLLEKQLSAPGVKPGLRGTIITGTDADHMAVAPRFTGVTFSENMSSTVNSLYNSNGKMAVDPLQAFEQNTSNMKGLVNSPFTTYVVNVSKPQIAQLANPGSCVPETAFHVTDYEGLHPGDDYIYEDYGSGYDFDYERKKDAAESLPPPVPGPTPSGQSIGQRLGLTRNSGRLGPRDTPPSVVPLESIYPASYNYEQKDYLQLDPTQGLIDYGQDTVSGGSVTASNRYSPPQVALPEGLKVGATMSQTYTDSGTQPIFSFTNTVKVDTTFVGHEDVTVAAGTFPGCAKLTFTTTKTTSLGQTVGPNTSTRWYAKGVGLVQEDDGGGGLKLKTATVGGVKYPH